MQRSKLFTVALVFGACTPKADTIKAELIVPKASAEAKAKVEATPSGTTTVTAATEKAEGDCHHEDVQKADASAVIKRGAALKGDKAVALADLLATPEKFDAQTVTTEGSIRQVCQKAGCWMELATGEKGAGARITFKDYGFFVPKDSQKSIAKVEGTVKLAELSEARAAHYASEGATVPRGADGKAREVQIVASGVEIRKN